MTKDQFIEKLQAMGIHIPKKGRLMHNIAVDNDYRDSIYIIDKHVGATNILYVGYRNHDGVYELRRTHKFRLKHVETIGAWVSYTGEEAIANWSKFTNINKLMDKL